MYVNEMPNQVKRPAIEVKFENHPKTRPDPDLMPMNPSRAKDAQKMTETYGRPLRPVFRKIFGAFPASARPSAENDQREMTQRG